MSKKISKIGIVIGIILTLSPVWGMLGTVIGMTRAFSQLSGQGVGDPEVLSGHLGTTLLSTAIGLMLFPVGLIILIVSIIFYVKHKKSIQSGLSSQ